MHKPSRNASGSIVNNLDNRLMGYNMTITATTVALVWCLPGLAAALATLTHDYLVSAGERGEFPTMSEFLYEITGSDKPVAYVLGTLFAFAVAGWISVVRVAWVMSKR